MLWQRVQAAYERSDLEGLRALWDLTGQLAPDVTPPASLESLQAEREMLRRQTERLTRQTAELQQRPPFSLQAKLGDEAWVADRRAEIEAQIAALQEQRRALELHLRTLAPEMAHGNWPSPN